MNFTKAQLEQMVERQKATMFEDRKFYSNKLAELEKEVEQKNKQIIKLEENIQNNTQNRKTKLELVELYQWLEVAKQNGDTNIPTDVIQRKLKLIIDNEFQVFDKTKARIMGI